MRRAQCALQRGGFSCECAGSKGLARINCFTYRSVVGGGDPNQAQIGRRAAIVVGMRDDHGPISHGLLADGDDRARGRLLREQRRGEKTEEAHVGKRFAFNPHLRYADQMQIPCTQRKRLSSPFLPTHKRTNPSLGAYLPYLRSYKTRSVAH